MVNRKKLSLIAILVFMFTLVMTCAFISFANTSTSALNASDLASATKVGSGAELFDAATGEFNGTVTTDLVSKLFGTSDPVAYIKTDGADDYALNYFKSSTPYYVVPSSKINTKASVGDEGLVVKLGGLNWMVASLTLADVGSDPKDLDNVILTLYLADGVSGFMEYTYVGYSSGNPSNIIYSTSKVRDKLLNLHPSGTDSFSQFNLFRGGSSSSLTPYLVQPKYIKYQEVESPYNRGNPLDGLNVNMPNDAYGKLVGKWGNVVAGGTGDSTYSPESTYKNSVFTTATNYDEWKNDYIWLPSVTEVGGLNQVTNNIWRLSNKQRQHSITGGGVWTRSGHEDNSTASFGINSSGTIGFRNGASYTTCVLRPAIHLNITSLLKLREPTAIDDAIYNGQVQTLETLKSGISWYNSAYADPSKVSVTYSSAAKDVGTYTVTMTIQNAAKDTLKWWDQDTNASLTRTTTLKINQKDIGATIDLTASPPTVTPTGLCSTDSALSSTLLKIHYTGTTGSGASYNDYTYPSQVGNYTATAEIDTSVTGSGNYKLDKTYAESITIGTSSVTMPVIQKADGTTGWYTYDTRQHAYEIIYDKSLIEITIDKAYSGKYSFDGDFVKVTDAGVYTDALKVHLKNGFDSSTGNGKDVWNMSTNDAADKYLSFTVEQVAIPIDFTADASGSITGPIGSSLTVTMLLGAMQKPLGSDTVDLTFTASRNGTGTPITVCNSLTVSNSTANSSSVNFDISGITVDGRYRLAVSTSNTNYAVSLKKAITLVLVTSSSSPDLVWILQEDGVDTSFTENAPVGTTTLNFSATTLVYNGKTYTFYASAPFGYDLVGTVTTVKAGTTTPIGSVTDAGNYETTVNIRPTGTTSTPTPYKLNWSINKAMFDLSGVVWLNNGNVEFADKNVHPEIDASTLPAGLLVDNIGGVNVGTNVGDGGIANVTFKLDPAYANNYECPASGGKDKNYKFGGSGDFEWNKTWHVVPAEIDLIWTNKSVTDINGASFDVLVLSDPRVNGKINYQYFESDNSGNVTNTTPLSESDIVFSATNRKYYVALPAIVPAYVGNYVFKGGSATYSPVFTVGGGSSLITVDLAQISFEYNGSAINVNVVITGMATINDLTLTYYSGTLVDPSKLLTGAPTDAGDYVLVIASSNSGVIIGGNDTFNITVTKNRVALNWKTSVKPPTLDLKPGQTGAVEYEIVDSAGNPVASISAITPGDYAIRAKIKDRANYIFDDDTYESAWQNFNVKQGDSITDPSNPDNPFNPGNGQDDNAFIKFFKDLIEKNFPLWQIATIAVGGLLSIIFLIKSIQYGNRRKKAKGEAKKYSTKTAAALLPVFDSTLVLAGLSNKIWSIIAFAMVGVTVLMFLIAIITRKGWKKAEAAKEQAMTASGVNPQTGALVPVNNNDTVALLAEMRREMQENFAKANSEAQSGVQSDLERRLIEMEERRHADEERHRQEMEALREEQRRENERREEEQAKRDEAMKIMLANLMGRQQGADGDMSYASMDDTDLLVQKVIAGLLPAVQQMMPEPTAYLSAPGEQDDRINSLVNKIDELQNQIADMSHNVYDAEIIPDNSEEIQALKEEHSAELKAMSAEMKDKMQAMSDEHFAEMQAMRSQLEALSSMSVDELDDEDFDDEEEWDSILDEDDDDFVEAVIIDDNGKERKVYPNFRMRLKQSSDKNREWYAVIKNLFCSQKGVTYRVYKRVEKIRYQGQVIAVIGIAKRSIKLWLALKPYEYDARRYHHKDVSDKSRFVDVPMYVRITSDRALDRSQELILALFQELNMEARKRYTDRSIQELIFTLKHNRLLTNKQNKQLLCETMHVHDCDVLDDETAEKCIEAKNVESLDESNIETVKLDDIDAKFQDGNRVTLDRLKKVGLVSEDCTGYTVTADKRLTKPLIIVANDFSLTAVKLIVLTGGRAIRLQTV